jgi:hypothetical protein
MRFQQNRLELLFQIGREKKILSLVQDVDEIKELLVNKKLFEIYYEFYGPVHSFGEKILQDDKIKVIQGITDELSFVNNKTLFMNIKDIVSKTNEENISDFKEIMQEVHVLYNMAALKHVDY